MPLQVTEWVARLKGKSDILYLPFDANFDGGSQTNQMPFRKIGGQANWHVFVSFVGPLDPADNAYPHFARLEDEGDFATLIFNCKWSSRAGIQYGMPGSQGPIPTTPGKRHVRITLLNQNQQPLAAQSGDYYLT